MSNWMDAAQKFGWSEEDCQLFLSTHPDAKNVQFDTKFRHVTYDHTSVMLMSGTGRDGREYVHEVKSVRRGSWDRPKRGEQIVKTWSNQRFDGQWCPCHGGAGCSGRQTVTERVFCDCGAFVHPDGKRQPYVDGRKNVHKRHCSLRGTEDEPVLIVVQNPDGTMEEKILQEPGAAAAAAASAPVAQPKPKPKKREKRVIESLSLPGMGGKGSGE